MSKGKEKRDSDEGTDLEQAMNEAVQAIEKREESNSEAEEDQEGVDILGADEDDAQDVQGDSKTDAASAVTEALIAAKKELEEALEQTRTQYTQLRAKWMRSAADLENYKKRARREREEAVKFGNEKLIKDILPVFDDLDRTLEVVDANAGEGALQSVIDGVTMVQKKFLAQLEKHDVVSFESKGTAFDPAQHEAVNQVFSNDVEAGGVVTDMRRGFFLSGRLLRPSLVTVSLGSEHSSDKPEEPADEGESTSHSETPVESVENQESGE